MLSRSSISSTRHPGHPVQVEDDRRVEVAGAGAHHQALQRGQAHRGVHAAAARDRGGAGAVAQVQHDDVHLARTGGPAARRCAGRRTRARCRGSRTGGCRYRAGDLRRRSRSVAAASGIVRWNAVSKTATCGRSGSSARATAMPVRFAGLCSGASGTSSLDLGDHLVVDQRRLGEPRSAVHHPVADRGQPGQVQAAPGPARTAVVVVGRAAARLADPLDEPIVERRSRRRAAGTSPTTSRS